MSDAKQQKITAKIANLQMQLDFFHNQLITETDPRDLSRLEKEIAKLNQKMDRLRFQITPEIQQTKTDQLYIKQKKYRSWLIFCLTMIVVLGAILVITIQNYSQLQISYRSANYWVDYYREETEILNKKLQKFYGSDEPVPTLSPQMEPNDNPIESDDLNPEVVTPAEINPDENTFYYVRKSATDKESQLGAFKILDNAKKLADENKKDGYKVYDAKGLCIYNPNQS